MSFRVFYIILFILCVSARRLTFHDGVFRIMQITDTHIGDDQDLDVQTKEQILNLLNYEKPDVVALTGDFIAGTNWNKTEGWFKEKWEYATSVFTETQTPYFYTLGNHDDEGELNREQIMELDITHEFSLSQVGKADLLGSSNYFIPVYNSDNETVHTILWSFDSMGYRCNNKPGYGCVGNTTIEWYKEQSDLLKSKYKYINSYAFQHIPPKEYMFSWNDITFKRYGEKYEKVACSSDDNGQIKTFLSRNEVKAFFVGHDHMNNYHISYKGIELVYGLKTGMGSYGPKEGTERGIRMITISEHDSSIWSTYLRTNSLKFVQQNETKVVTMPQYLCDGEENLVI